MDDPDELEEVAGVEEDDEVAVVVANVAMVGTMLPGTLLVCMRSYFTKLRGKRRGRKEEGKVNKRQKENIYRRKEKRVSNKIKTCLVGKIWGRGGGGKGEGEKGVDGEDVKRE